MDNTSEGNTSEDKTIREQILFYFKDCAKKFEKLRWNRDRTKMVLSPCLTGISTSPSFHKLIFLCSKHDPTILRSVLRIALDECTEAEKTMNEEKESKKREAEIQPSSKVHKKTKVQRRSKATTASSQSHDCDSTSENASMSLDTTSNGSDIFVPNPVVDANQSIKATLEPSSIPSPLRSSVTSSLPAQETRLTNNPTKTKTPTAYEIELGLVRGEEKIKEYVMKECFPLSDNHRANNKWFSKADDLRELFLIFRKFPFRIVKDRLLRELKSRIVVPGQKTAIPSTADLFNPSDILDALQTIKMTTINAKVNRAYGQMRLYKSVQGKIEGGYVPDNALTHGVAAHTSLLAKMACHSAGNVSEQERRDRINSFNYEYDAGKKWLEVAEWFGGEGIVLIFATAGVWNQSSSFCVLI